MRRKGLYDQKGVKKFSADPKKKRPFERSALRETRDKRGTVKEGKNVRLQGFHCYDHDKMGA